MKSGLCSISMRQLKPREVVELVRQAGLDGIEWAGNVHVPPGCAQQAAAVRTMTEDAGLAVSSYGSYWKVTDEEGRPEDFSPVLESALALGTDTIRIWAGRKSSVSAADAERNAVISGIVRALEAAAPYGIKLAAEFHTHTLSDNNDAARKLLDTVPHANFYTYWQPMYWLADPGYCLQGLQALADRVLNLHVFHWLFHSGLGDWVQSTERRPLAEGAPDWKRYLQVDLKGFQPHYALLEFVQGDAPAQFLEDAAELRQWLSEGTRQADEV